MTRAMTIVADDYGIGPETSRGILELANRDLLTATVLIVNTPYAEAAVKNWQAAAPDADLGWHPNLTLDQPLSPPGEVPSLVGADGRFHPLGKFLKRMALGAIRREDAVRELEAQYRRFAELVGRPPAVVNSHQHVSLFPPVHSALLEVLDSQTPKPYLRRVTEQIGTLWKVRGARAKRLALSLWGRRAADKADASGYPGCDWLAGVTDPGCVSDGRFWVDWLRAVPRRGRLEICCHPGYHDATLVGRDCDAGDGLLRRTREMALLQAPEFRTAWEGAGFAPRRPSRLAA